MGRSETAGPSDKATRLLAACLVTPAHSLTLGAAEWNMLLRSLRRNALLGTFAEMLAQAALLESTPAKARIQMAHARIAAESSRTAIRYEVNRMLRAVASYDGPLVLLKGTAYEFGQLPPKWGRVTGDVDIMVPREDINEVERALVAAGWRIAAHDAYDQRYYRQWSHELPPLVHPLRETAIDLHHTIAPPMGRARPDASALLGASKSTSLPRARVLAPADMVLHSVVHLFQDEVSRPLRDLFDIDRLTRHFGRDPAFWTQLCDHAALHRVERPLYYALRIVRAVFQTPIPDSVTVRLDRAAPNRLLSYCMDQLFRRLFAAEFSVSVGTSDRLVRYVLRARSQWLRMPPLLLARHLAHKTVRRAGERWRRFSKQSALATIGTGVAARPE